jgi:hypothetical protein
VWAHRLVERGFRLHFSAPLGGVSFCRVSTGKLVDSPEANRRVSLASFSSAAPRHPTRGSAAGRWRAPATHCGYPPGWLPGAPALVKVYSSWAAGTWSKIFTATRGEAVRFEEEARQMMPAGEYQPLIDYGKLGRDALLSIPTPDHYLLLPGEGIADIDAHGAGRQGSHLI